MLVIRTASALHVRALAARAFFSNSLCYSKDYASSSDDEKEPKKKKGTKKPKPGKVADTPKATETEAAQKTATAEADLSQDSAASRLNRLLASMQTDENYSFAAKQLSMAKPGEGNKKLKEEVKKTAEKKDVFVAAKRVAELLGNDGDKKQTESELLSKLLGHSQTDAIVSDQDKATNATPTGNESDLSLGELIVGMKIDRNPQPKEPDTRADFVRRAIASKQPYQGQNAQRSGADGTRRNPKQQRTEQKRAPEGYTGSVNLFGSEPVGIFKDVSSLQDTADILTTWAHLQQRELKLQVTHPCLNYFEKMALWTEQGKVWRFPIDNEQDLPEEIASEDFSDHIFLEQHLESWCPNKGPIRHFMELVCVGLSKNPYITAKEKKEHILWYRDYFEAKKDILRDLMNLEKVDKGTPSKQEIAES